MTRTRTIQGTSRSLNVCFKNPEEATSPMAGICKSVIAAIFVWLVPQDMNFCSSYTPPSYETLDLHASLLLRALHRNGNLSLSLEITNVLFVFHKIDKTSGKVFPFILFKYFKITKREFYNNSYFLFVNVSLFVPLNV